MFANPKTRCVIAFVVGMLLVDSHVSVADDQEKGTATAPPGADAFETSFEGTWFVDRELKKRYDALIAGVSDVEQRVRKGKLSANAARDEITSLRETLADVRKMIDESKTLVSPFKIVTKEVEGTVEIGPERLLVVTADRLKVVGWDSPFVKYVVVKSVLSTGKPVDEHIDAIKVIHEHRLAPDLVGKTDTEMKAWRDAFLTPKKGETWTAEQLQDRKDLWQRHFAHGERFQPFVGREVDTIHLEGLVHQEGNRNIQYEIKRPGGGGQFGGRWQRNADVSLYVPKCTALLLRGCQRGMDISGVNGHLMMTSSGSQNRDYHGKFAVRNHTGPITILNVPMDIVNKVDGSVTIQGTTEMVNTGSHHSGGDWVMTTPSARRLTVSEVAGNLTAHFTRSELHVDSVDGVLNIRNEFGDTHCTISKPFGADNHRIVSQSGLVSVRIGSNVDVKQPVFATTNCGTAATNLSRSELDDLNVTFSSSTDGLRRTWRSLHSTLPEGDFQARFALHHRPDDILNDRERSHGLDLLSVSGRVEYRKE